MHVTYTGSVELGKGREGYSWKQDTGSWGLFTQLHCYISLAGKGVKCGETFDKRHRCHGCCGVLHAIISYLCPVKVQGRSGLSLSLFLEIEQWLCDSNRHYEHR